MINIARSAARNIPKIGRITRLARDATRVAMMRAGPYTQNSENNISRPRTEDPLPLPLLQSPSETQRPSISIQASTVEEAVEDTALRRR